MEAETRAPCMEVLFRVFFLFYVFFFFYLLTNILNMNIIDGGLGHAPRKRQIDKWVGRERKKKSRENWFLLPFKSRCIQSPTWDRIYFFLGNRRDMAMKKWTLLSTTAPLTCLASFLPSNVARKLCAGVDSFR